MPGWLAVSRSLIYEIALPEQGSHRPPASGIGLTDWSQDFGIDKSLYRPATFDKLERQLGSCTGRATDEVAFRAQLLGVVEYKKRLTERSLSVLPPDLTLERPFRVKYDVEVVLLEIRAAAPMCHK